MGTFREAEIMLLSLLITSCLHLVTAQSPEYWYRVADQELEQQLKSYPFPSTTPAKNIIFFIGDGMGISTVTGARILKSQINNRTAGSDSLAMDKLPVCGLIKTYNTDRMVSDSASTATAYWTGSKTKQWLIGVDEQFAVRDCQSTASQLKSIAMHAIDAGKSVGIVTTTSVTHASPAPAYAHATRSWESDKRLEKEAKSAGCTDIARQLIDKGVDINVVLGGGLSHFSAQSRADRRDLVAEWKSNQNRRSRKWSFVTTRSELESVNATNTDFLLGLFASGELAFEADRKGLQEVPGIPRKVPLTVSKSGAKKSTRRPPRAADDSRRRRFDEEPSLREMTRKAIEVLSRNPRGYFLFVEGAKIDYGHHAGKAAYALLETLSFDEAIEQAVAQTRVTDGNPDNTLVVVSADHSHTLTIGGNDPRRDHHLMDTFTDHKAADDMPYTILAYANGPGGTVGQKRRNLTGYNTRLLGFGAPAAIPLPKETHGGEDVPLFAVGSYAYLFSGVHEQNYIPIAMQFAGCFGRKPNGTHCAL